MTEDEAKTKWCPMARFLDGDDIGGANRWRVTTHDGLAHKECLCIGSDCMMWREVERVNKQSSDLYTVGYCGLGGTPS